MTLQIGQHGATDAIVAELQEQVRRKKVVKAKRLKTTVVAGSEKDFWSEIAERARVRLLEVRGHAAVFADPAFRTDREQKRERTRPSTPRNA
ncbi:MAG TPA: YhbY family RNA-binding protein [Candidatus Thermoplasmatota archaeon]|nr:YhbY family RNA-binding protein [Candidatus Thermoplasmatota archaeon]